jgi:hypothetical protein
MSADERDDQSGDKDPRPGPSERPGATPPREPRTSPFPRPEMRVVEGSERPDPKNTIHLDERRTRGRRSQG